MDKTAEIWSRSTGAEFLRAMSEGKVPVPPHAAFVGLAVRAVGEGRIEMAWSPGEPLRNPGGMVHGGYIAMVLDDTAALSCSTLADRYRPMLTLYLHLDFIRPVVACETYALIGEVAHAGAARLVADARIVSAAGKLHARATGSFLPNQAFDPTRPA